MSFTITEKTSLAALDYWRIRSNFVTFQVTETILHPNHFFSGHPRCNIIYSLSLFYGLLSGLGSLLRMFVSNKLYYIGGEPSFPDS